LPLKACPSASGSLKEKDSPNLPLLAHVAKIPASRQAHYAEAAARPLRFTNCHSLMFLAP